MSLWGYGKIYGPETWSKSFPAAGGQHQSPINIITKNVDYDCHLEKDKIKIKILEEKCKEEQILIFHGHNFKIEGKCESVIVSGGPLSHIGEFKFVQLHFHWGQSESENGSEHQIDGERFPAELHMVHYNASKYKNFDEAAPHSDGLLVLGIFIKIGNKNRELDKLMRPLSSVRSLYTINLVEEQIYLDLKHFLPHDTEKYYTYSGSLTTPPCYESVTWVVFHHPISMTEDQILQFRWIHMGDDCGTSANFRPECPLNHRKVKKSFK